jgi:DNA repair protein RadA/Sms
MKISKAKIIYVCQNCGNSSPRWIGKCPACDEWNTVVEEITTKDKLNNINISSSKPISISEISPDQSHRRVTNIVEMDRVLGGGLIRGSTVLIGGDPGIGKSTLALQIPWFHCLNRGRPRYREIYISPSNSRRIIR